MKLSERVEIRMLCGHMNCRGIKTKGEKMKKRDYLAEYLNMFDKKESKQVEGEIHSCRLNVLKTMIKRSEKKEKKTRRKN